MELCSLPHDVLRLLFEQDNESGLMLALSCKILANAYQKIIYMPIPVGIILRMSCQCVGLRQRRIHIRCAFCRHNRAMVGTFMKLEEVTKYIKYTTCSSDPHDNNDRVIRRRGKYWWCSSKFPL